MVWDRFHSDGPDRKTLVSFRIGIHSDLKITLVSTQGKYPFEHSHRPTHDTSLILPPEAQEFNIWDKEVGSVGLTAS